MGPPGEAGSNPFRSLDVGLFASLAHCPGIIGVAAPSPLVGRYGGAFLTGEEDDMEYRTLGSSGLQVSGISLGTATFGVRPRADEVNGLVHSALEVGINFFDCANSYGNRPHFDQPGAPVASERASAEELLGLDLKDHRAEVIIATKVDEPMGTGPNDRGL